MDKKKIKQGFTAELCNFQGKSGYMLHQWYNYACICSQFIPQEHYTEFCEAAGIDANKIIL